MLGKYTQEMAIRNKDTALMIAGVLVEEEYVVQLSKEDNLWIINYENTTEWGESNRNGTVFMSVGEFDDKYYEREESQLNKECMTT